MHLVERVRGAALPVLPLGEHNWRARRHLGGDASSGQFVPDQKHGKLWINADKSLIYPKGIFLSDVLELKPAIKAGDSLLKTLNFKLRLRNDFPLKIKPICNGVSGKDTHNPGLWLPASCLWPSQPPSLAVSSSAPFNASGHQTHQWKDEKISTACMSFFFLPYFYANKSTFNQGKCLSSLGTRILSLKLSLHLGRSSGPLTLPMLLNLPH